MADRQPYIAQASCVASFAVDKEIRYKVKEVERAFHNVVSGEVANTNVSDSMPPPIPRLTLESGPKQLAISQLSAQLQLSFSDKSKSVKETYEIIAKNALQFWDAICELKQPSDRRDVGVVLKINCPSTLTKEKVAQTIQEKYTKLPMLGQLVNAQLSFGFLVAETEIFRNVSVGVYQIRKGAIEGRSGEMISIDLETLEIVEHGFEIKMDVNTKPMVKDGRLIADSTGKLVVDELHKLIFDIGSQFLVW